MHLISVQRMRKPAKENERSGQRRRVRNFALCCAVFLAFANMAIASATPGDNILLYSDADHSARTVMQSPPGLIDALMTQSKTTRDEIQQCLAENALKTGQVDKLFEVTRIDLNGDTEPDYFIRSSRSRFFCNALNGSHIFRFWFATGHAARAKTRYRIAFESGGDAIMMLADEHHGYRDLIMIGADGANEYRMHFVFDGASYRMRSCRRKEFLFEDGSRDHRTCD